MARKTKRPRNTRPATAAPETDPNTLADLEAAQSDLIEEAEIVAGADETAGADQIAPAEDAVPVEQEDVSEGEASSDASATEAEVVTPDETDPSTADASADDVAPNNDTVPPEDTGDVEDLARMDGADPAEMEAAAQASASDEAVKTDEADETPQQADMAPEPVPAAPPQVIQKSGPGFVPLVLGGLIAGAIGYAIPTFFSPPPPPAASPAALAALEARIDGLPAGSSVDLSPVEAELAALAERISALEARPVTAAAQSAGASTAVPSGEAEALAALRADVDGLAALRADVEGLSGVTADLSALSARIDALATQVSGLPTPPPDMSDRVAALEAGLVALDAETEAVEVSAEELAREAAANQIRIAVDSGVPFAEPLAVIGGDVPDVLAENADAGLPTDDTLTAAFPEAARIALAEARKAQPEEGGGLSAFIRRTAGARSLEPREGDDADAVLSRAEAAIAAGDVGTALAEVEGLPPEAQDAMAGWIADARTRAAAQAALTDYLGTE